VSEFRTEKDSLGEVKVPAQARWGAQTQRAVDNFPVSGQPMPPAFISAVAQIKCAAAQANASLGLLSTDLREAIVKACQRVSEGEFADQFPVDRYQTGSGTSTNMNVNEVVASICREQGVDVHPNDHINMSQSSNDVIPTAIHVSSFLAVKEQLLPAISHLRGVIYEREAELLDQVMTGRTHLMDAMPVTMGQELRTWGEQLAAVERRLEQACKELSALPQGGTAVGTGVNADEEFAGQFIKFLKINTGHSFRSMDHKFVGQSAVDGPVALSAQLRGAAVVLTKIANDLRWMNSGPIHGLAEALGHSLSTLLFALLGQPQKDLLEGAVVLTGLHSELT
jgi:fumarate hydratase class II